MSALRDWVDRIRLWQRTSWDLWRISGRWSSFRQEPVVEEPVVEEPEPINDTFDFTFKRSENKRGRDIITTELTVSDSLTDNNYIGGDDLFLEISGGWEDHRGRKRFMSQRVSIDSFGPIDGSKEYFVGNTRIARIFDNADEVTVSLTNGLGSDADVFFTEVFDSTDVVDTLA